MVNWHPVHTYLLEVQLAEELGVSRGPVREALIYLKKEELVVNQPYRGKFVANVSATTVHEIYSMRRLLEGYAAQSVATKLQPEQLERLQNLFDEMMRAVRSKRFEEFADTDLEFHASLSEQPSMIASCNCGRR